MSDFGELSEERLERGLMVAAYVVSRHGAKYAPLFARLERELAEFRAREDPVSRARRYLQSNCTSFDQVKNLLPNTVAR